ncbi:MAG: hypothetical protein VW405_20210, partial [Rhodospirillaceae bacterium]
ARELLEAMDDQRLPVETVYARKRSLRAVLASIERVSVPREPTEAMLVAGHDALTLCLANPPAGTVDDVLQGRTCHQAIRDCYCAMLTEAKS